MLDSQVWYYVEFLCVCWSVGCCEREVIRTHCRRLCSHNSLLTHLNDPDLLSCMNYLRNIVGCVIGMSVFISAVCPTSSYIVAAVMWC